MTQQLTMEMEGIEIPTTRELVTQAPVTGPFIQDALDAIDCLRDSVAQGDPNEESLLNAQLAVKSYVGAACLAEVFAQPEETVRKFLPSGHGALSTVLGSIKGDGILESLKRQVDGEQKYETDNGLVVVTRTRENTEYLADGNYVREVKSPRFDLSVDTGYLAERPRVHLSYAARLRGPGSIYAERAQRWNLRWEDDVSGATRERTISTGGAHHQGTSDYYRFAVRDGLILPSGDLVERTFYRTMGNHEYDSGNHDRTQMDRDIIDEMMVA